MEVIGWGIYENERERVASVAKAGFRPKQLWRKNSTWKILGLLGLNYSSALASQLDVWDYPEDSRKYAWDRKMHPWFNPNHLNQISPTSRAVHFPSWLPTSLHAPAFFRSESHSFNRTDEWMLPKMTFSLHMFCCPLIQNINYFIDQYPYRCTPSQFSKIFNDVAMVIDTDFKGERHHSSADLAGENLCWMNQVCHLQFTIFVLVGYRFRFTELQQHSNNPNSYFTERHFSSLIWTCTYSCSFDCLHSLTFCKEIAWSTTCSDFFIKPLFK